MRMNGQVCVLREAWGQAGHEVIVTNQEARTVYRYYSPQTEQIGST